MKKKAKTKKPVYKPKKKGRGFASMDPDKQRAIASKGGKMAHKMGRGHEFTPEEARRAGKIGGRVTQAKRKK